MPIPFLCDKPSHDMPTPLRQFKRLALFLVAGNKLMAVRDGTIRCGAMMGRGDTTASVWVGCYQTNTARFADVMDDVLCAHKRSETLRRATYFKRKRREV